MKRIALILFCLLSMAAKAQTPQQIADYLTLRCELHNVTPDSLFNTIRRLEQMRDEATDSVEWAVMSELLAIAYEDNVAISQHRARGERLEEWGREQWLAAAAQCRLDARTPMKLLRATKAADWKPVVALFAAAKKKGKNRTDSISGSRWYDDDLLHIIHLRYPTDEVARYYDALRKAGSASGNAAILARLPICTDPDSLLLVADADPSVADDVRVLVYERIIESRDLVADKVKVIDECLSRFGGLSMANSVRNTLAELQTPTLSFQWPQRLYPDHEYTVPVEYRNISGVKLRIGDVEQTLPVKQALPHETVLDTLRLVAPSTGAYKVEVKPVVTAKVARDAEPDTFTVYVSPLRLLRLSMPDGETLRHKVVDALIGAEVPGHRVLSKTVKEYRRDVVKYYIEGDPQPPVRDWTYGRYDSAYSTQTNTRIYTDRAIYRPGQTVNVSLVRYRQCHWDAEAASGDTLTVELFDPDCRSVHAEVVTLNDFGVGSCSFTLPDKCSLGSFHIRTEGTRHFLRVEEYKRPTFDVTLSDSLLCPLPVTVANFNGTPLRHARIIYKVSKSGLWWARTDGQEIVNDTVYADDRGVAMLPVTLTAQDSLDTRWLAVDATVTSSTGETHSARRVYRLGAQSDEPAPVVRPEAEFKCPRQIISPDSAATITVESRFSDVHLFVAVFRQNECIDEREVVFSDSLVSLSFGHDLLASHPNADGLGVTVAFMKEGRLFAQSFTLERQRPDTRLRWAWETFRDYVRPGDEEVWTGRLLKPDGTPADASAMFTIYDASLDAIEPHDWSLSVNRRSNIFSTSYANLHPQYVNGSSMWTSPITLSVRGIGYHHLAPSLLESLGIPFAVRGGVYHNYAKPSNESLVLRELRVRGKSMNTADGVLESAAAPAAPDDEADGGEKSRPQVIREAMEESALFEPSLMVDSQGRLTLRFTVPDAMTTWRVLGVAHTRDMMTTEIDSRTIAQKSLMTLVDVPRFVRRGDQAAATVTVQNITGKSRRVSLEMSLLDPASERALHTERRTFDLQGDTVFVLRFEADQPYIVRSFVEAGDEADGEQREVPILDEHEWTARSVDLAVTGTGDHKFQVDSLFTQEALERRITIQYTESPVWTAVEVLRNIAVPEHDDAISLHTALYAHHIMRHLSQRDSLVADYLQFDPSRTDADIQDLTARLRALQDSDGGFGWVPGCGSSQWITTEVATTFARLRYMTGFESDMLKRAVTYLRDKAQRRAEWLRAHESDNASTLDLQYLYVLALAGEDMDDDSRYLLTCLRNYAKTMSREQIALMAVVEDRLGKASLADTLRQSLRHYLVNDPRMGTSFSYLRGSFTSIDRKLLDHVYAIEALKGGEEQPEMLRHLLNQKRVQAWANPLVNASAVYALLIDSLSVRQQYVHDRLFIDDDVMRVTDGRLQETYDVSDHVQTIVVEKRGGRQSWGAVYVESLQRIEDITPHGSELTIRRYVEGDTAVGGRAEVRLVIHADRDYECVLIENARPACLEPLIAISRWQYQGGLGFYHEVRDQQDNLLIERLPKGDYILTLPAYAVRPGNYNTGITKIRCLYAPEFCGNTANGQVEIN